MICLTLQTRSQRIYKHPESSEVAEQLVGNKRKRHRCNSEIIQLLITGAHLMSEHSLQNVAVWGKKEAVLQCHGDLYRHSEAFLSGMSTLHLYLTSSITWAVQPAGLQQYPQSVWDRLGTAGAIFIISMAAEDSPALQESSAATYTLPPLFCKRVYISFEEAMGAHKLDWLLYATVSPPFFCTHLLLSYCSGAIQENNIDE